ncbi:DUF4870 domain-containing protein [Pseudofulvibacter geojedonensis]|uniref:DUF4870 domain-containing protein n=1 Tax=Pseudofulvibacter geojedonensis TaxID=1123758 RepID=A0ABW3HZA4_9FLAO
MLQEDRSILSLLHFSQLLDFITGFGGLLVPLFIWLFKKDEIYKLDKEGKQVINFQLSMLLLGIIAIPLILALGLGLLILFVIPFIIGIYSIINGFKAKRGEDTYYPLTYEFLK